MFANFFLKSFRILLLPFSLVYWLIIYLRNWLYDSKILEPVSFGLPIICVGNLSFGGTGKSPMVEYLVENLKNNFHVATLSRGYKRKTSGYALADENSTALEIGDEPMQFYLKFPDVAVAVGERRIEAIPQLLHDRSDTDVIILDDAFQHRQINPGLNILLTEYNNLFTRDFYFPTGDLRDLRSSCKRAEVIIVTKCKPDLTNDERKSIIEEIKPEPHQNVFFTCFLYGELFHITRKHHIEFKKETDVLLVTGIANPLPLKKMLEKNFDSYSMLQYPDHHIFTIDDLRDIKKKFDLMQADEKIIISTEKDAVRMIKFKADIEELPFFIIPIRHQFLFDETEKFNNLVTDFIKGFQKSN